MIVRISLLLFICLHFSCKSVRVVEEKIEDYQGSCYNFLEGIEASRPDEFERDDFDEDLQEIFSDKALVIANALNLKEQLRELIHFDDIEKNRIEYFIQYQEIINKITLSELEVSSLNAAVSCEEDKTQQLAWYLDRQESNVSNRRTIAGIFTDASASLISGGIVLWAAGANTFRQLLGVGASLTQITLNLISKREVFKVRVSHEVNLLREIYDDDAGWSNFIPPAVWYYIHEKRVAIQGGSIREQMLKTWNSLEIQNDLDLYLSDGGAYTEEQLRSRASMLDLFSSNIELMKQDLLAFRREIVDYKREE
ncbi:hypothetical protein [Lunatibacter salilacus]|uniref:hypothetical protein n=1 Tax=Lunatibacter salilacus TaxID=2483804 RepID=UPI00131D9E40|nr:hypothetical protein [Lunatibacter salilacus]